MPNRDGTGPMGNGSMKTMGNRNRQGGGKNCCGKGSGLGFRCGEISDSNLSDDVTSSCRGKGFNNIANLSAQDELAFLKNKANNMENNLNKVKERISELEKK